MPISSKAYDYIALTRHLNSLLKALHIPFSLQSPIELTPSLLILILERLLSSPIPRIPYDVQRESLENLNLQNIKLFLGLLETDLLRRDVGLSKLDPRKLASGGFEECSYVGTLLCWMGRRLGFIVADDPFEIEDDAPSVPIFLEAHSPSTSIITKDSTAPSNLFLHYSSDSNTSVELPLPSTPTPKSTPRSAHHSKARSRYIHEAPPPFPGSPASVYSSIATEQSFRDSLSPSPKKTPVRRSGYISPVDEEMELLCFERNHNIADTHSSPSTSRDSQADTTFSLAALRETRDRTLFLLQKRARLMEEKALLESQMVRPRFPDQQDL
ncbi:hypothetical protein H0H92_004148 [Tricholoma furcatifolium]|nr:hypothetical protein H0H92_004148 [Tricholoma furcatifolium]